MSLTNEGSTDKLPSNHEHETNRNTVDRILDQTIEKMKISFLIPRIVQDSETAIERLIKTEFKFCADMLRDYVDEKKIVQGKGLQHDSSQSYEDQKLMRLIDIFQENHNIVKYFPDWLTALSQEEKNSITELVLLRSIAKERFNVRAIAQLEEEKELIVLYAEYLDNLKNLEALDNIMSANQLQTRWRSAARRSTIQSVSSKVDDEINDFKNMREKARAEFSGRLNPQKHAERMKRAKEDLEAAKMELEKAKKSNVIEENSVRNEHNKWKIQLQSLMKKYDQNMIEKFREKVYWEQQYNDALAENEMFMKQVYAPSERRYNNIVRARQLIEEQKWMEKVNEFIMNRAARVIQLAYRAYLRIHRPSIVPKSPKGKSKGKAKDKRK